MTLRIFCCVFTLFLAACGGGDGGGTGATGSTGGTGGSGGEQPSSNYSISVDQQELHFVVPFQGMPDSARVKVNFSGAGLVVGFAPQADEFAPLMFDTENVTSTSADVVIHYSPSLFSSLEKQYVTTLRFVTGDENGNNLKYKDVLVYATQQDGFAVDTDPLQRLAGAWGSTLSSQLNVSTVKKQWTATSSFAGLTLSPSSGAGSGSITISYDPQKTPPSTQSAEVVVTADTGETFTKTVELEIDVPPMVHLDMSVNFPNHNNGASLAPVGLSFNFANDVNVPWTARLPDWLSADRLQGISSVDGIAVYVDAGDFPDVSQRMSGVIAIDFDFAGEISTQIYPVIFPYEQLFYQASKQAFAFSDYATAETHTGEFFLNAPIDSRIDVTSSASWLVIDSAEGRKVTFHLEPSALAASFHEAEISLTVSGSNALVGETVNVGYYKSDVALSDESSEVWRMGAHAVSDKLGPWEYVIEPISDPANPETPQPVVITKYNLHTGNIDQTLQIPELTNIGAMAISNDGKTLFGISYNNTSYRGEFVRIDLSDFRTYAIANIDGPQSPTVIRYTQLNGKELISDGSSWFDAITGQIVYYSGDSGNSYYSQTGEFILASSMYTPGSIYQLPYTYSYLANSITSGESSTITIGGRTDSIHVSPNENWLSVVREDMNQTEGRFSLYQITRNAQGEAVLSEYETSEPMGQFFNLPNILTTSDGRSIVIMSVYSQTEGWQRAIRVYDKNYTLLDETLYSGLSDVPANRLRLTSDEKSYSYMVEDLTTETSTIITKAL